MVNAGFREAMFGAARAQLGAMSCMEVDDIPTGDGLETMECPDCDGSGFDDEDGSPCGNCGGLGYVDADVQSEGDA